MLSPSDAHQVDALSASNYAVEQRKYIAIASSLFETGVTVDIEIPMIAVVGVQSAGKSSLIEAMSGITLPRAGGTCTRCPTYCRLKYTASPWNCRVSLMWTKGPRDEDVPIVIERFGDDIESKEDVTERIRRAQRAILNRSTSLKTFLEGDDEDPNTSEITFSKNCVYLEISGSDVPDLSFVDLPGIIATSIEGVPGEIQLIRDLVTEYVSRPSCIILLTISCETELHNQGSFEIARLVDPKGERTIGVLTKPDRISAGDEDTWVAILRNQNATWRLENGWFSVKSPNTREIKEGMTHEQAREEEERFFLRTAPWCDLSMSSRGNLGSKALADRCSMVLSAFMAQRLPEIELVIQKSLQTTEEHLRELPTEPSQDPVGEVYNLISRFSMQLTRYLEGTPEPDGLLQTIRPYQDAFKIAIRGTAPNFQARDRALSLLAPVGDTYAQLIRRAITRELPDHYPFIITQEFVRELIEDWDMPTFKLFDEIEAILSSKIKKFIHLEFAQYPNLQAQAVVIVTDHIAALSDLSKEHLHWLIDVEKRPRTLNDHYYRDYRDKFLAWYKSQRPEYNNLALLDSLKAYDPAAAEGAEQQDTIGVVLSCFNKLGINGLRPTDLAKVLPTDPREAAIAIMASVRAYFQVAYKRFVDNVTIAIDEKLILGLNRYQVLESNLRTKLGVGSSDGYEKCSRYLQEDRMIAKYREDMRNKRDRLTKAKRELMKLRM
ncbi:hypothetical protein IEO21_08336 [Rhodonia placenta]|uniref:P-loop containing nucleoside triphosphate hydrolase protein n=1 Tax=Rhodonia placenta TaxID=104341 RepID=A0A8H7NWH3_9APHY|nr:hypothetical protein IEO21_08336 [Postia placenta]